MAGDAQLNSNVRKLNSIVLIDDDEPTTILHRRVIERAGVTERVMVFRDPEDALRYFAGREAPRAGAADELVLLDVNMPRMSGLEFLEAYSQLEPGLRATCVVILLTTQLPIEDRERAESFADVRDFLTKPLEAEMLQALIEQHFALRQKQPELKRK